MSKRDRQLDLFERGTPRRGATGTLGRTGATRFPSELPALGPVFGRLNARFFRGRLRATCEWSERLVASAGNCRPEERLIRISAPYHRRHPDVVRVTLAHEMCHLIVPGHGAPFRRLAEPIARALRVDWNAFRYATRWADLSRYHYVYACRRCGMEVPSRKRLVRASCGRCDPTGYRRSLSFVCIETRRNPGPVLLGQRPVRDLIPSP